MTVTTEEDTMQTTTTITGYDVIEYVETHPEHDGQISKYADPTEGARQELTLAEARDVAAEDPSLLHLTVPVEA